MDVSVFWGTLFGRFLDVWTFGSGCRLGRQATQGIHSRESPALVSLPELLPRPAVVVWTLF